MPKMDADLKTALLVELVPETAWFSNVRSMVSNYEWDLLRRESYARSEYKCEICGGVGMRHPVECHEVWEYNDETRVQTLKGLISLCPACHEIKHMGLARVRGRGEQASKHLAEINRWTAEQAAKHVAEAFEKWGRRSMHDWEIDLKWLDEKGIKYKNDR